MSGQARENKTCSVVVLLVQSKLTGAEPVDFGIPADHARALARRER
jgi:hypothetical protein